MGDTYYDRQGGYPASRDPYAQQDGRGSAYTAYPPSPGYNTYQPPTDEGYRPSAGPQNLQVAQYDDGHSRHGRKSGDYGARPRSRHGEDYYDDDRYSDRGHLPPSSPGSHRPASRGSHREKDRKAEVQSIGATILGGVAGALIGRKAGKREILPTVLGGVAGAWGGHKLEEEYAERKEGHGHRSRSKSRERESAYGVRGRERRRSNESEETDRKSFREKVKDRIRSLSRKRTDERSRSRADSRRRRDGSADSFDDRRDRRHSGRYESESREHYDRDDRYDRDRDRY